MDWKFSPGQLGWYLINAGLAPEALEGFATRAAHGFAVVVKEQERLYDRGVRLRALRKRHRWGKADLERLLRLPGRSSPATKARMARLAQDGRLGRPVVDQPKALPEKIVDGWNFYLRLWDPATPPYLRRKLYRQTSWWPRLIECSYRGELRRAKAARVIDRRSPHIKASEVAQAEVARAAGISEAQVHAICQRIRDQGGSDDPEMGAAQLRRHLENGPAETD
jgi:hypothetical protein